MNKKIKNYIDVLFSDIPKTVQSIELKEELLSNMDASMSDFMAQGLSENQAYSKVISNLGDIDDLLNQLPKPDQKEIFVNTLEDKKKSSLYVALGIFFIFLAVGAFPLMDSIMGGELSILAFFILIAAGVSLFIYSAHFSDKVETFTEADKKEKDKDKTISSLIWSIATLIFFVCGFVFNNWNAWVVFPLTWIFTEIIETLINIFKR